MNQFFTRTCLSIAAAAVLLVASGTALADGSDDLDSYASGTSLLTGGPTNGQITYVNSAPGGGPVLPPAVVEAVADGGAQSGPNVMRFADGAGSNSGAFRVRLEPASVIPLSLVGDKAEIAFDFETRSGCCGGQVSMSWKPLYSSNAFYQSEDNVDNQHASGIGDTGAWFLNNGAVNNTLEIPALPSYAANNWYRAKLTVERVGAYGGADLPTDYDYTLELIDIDGGNNSLGTLSAGTFRDANRSFLTGLGLFSSSNADEVTVFDNISFTTVSPAPPGPGTVRSADNYDSLGAGVEIRGTSNGDITWSDDAPTAGAGGGFGFNPPDSAAGHVITNTTDFQSGPHSMEILTRSDGGGGAMTGQLNPAQVIEVDADTSARFSVDFKTVGSPTSTAFKFLWSTDANGAAQDIIGNSHPVALGDNGGWGVNGNATQGPTLFSADTWYNMDVLFEANNPGEHDITMRLTDIATGAPLGAAEITGLGDAGRNFLTGLAIFGSSNPSEMILLDNLEFQCLGDCAGGPVLLFGDADNSGTVTADDLIAVQQNFGAVGPNGDGTDFGDANDDGTVTADDLIAVQQNFGATLGPAGSAVPEPASLWLLALGGLTAVRRVRAA